MRIVTPDEKNGIYLGRQGENLATQVQFDVNVAGWVETYGVGIWELLNRRPSDPAGYPVEISVEDNIIKWDLTATDLKYAGCGTCELVYYVDEVIAKSIIYGTQILPAIDGTGEIPEPWESWIDEVEEARDEAQAAAEAAAGSASSAEGFAQDASASAEAASGSATSAEADALKAEGFAVGEQNGQPVESGSPYHENNAKYYKEQAAELADQIEHSIDDIEALIPPQASPENQLADKNFVNSSISTNTANYISNNGQPFTSVEQLEAYSGPVSNNDYAFVTGTDSAGNTFYDRYKATVSEGVVSWAFEYRLNNSSFTAAQWAAIESGITASQVADYNAHLANENNPHNVTKEQIGLGNVDNTPDAQKPVSQAQAAALALKADKVVDAVAGDFAALDANGNLTDSGISPSDLELVKEVSNDPASSSFDIAIQDAQAAPVLGAVLKGKTAAINQLVGNSYAPRGATTIVVDSNNYFTLSDPSWTSGTRGIKFNIPTLTAHKYYARVDCTAKSDMGDPSFIYRDGSDANKGTLLYVSGVETKESITSPSADSQTISAYFTPTSAANSITFRFMLIDLTLCGFTASETTDVATLKAAWLKKYGVPMPQSLPYNAGSILSDNATYQLTGRNIIDESKFVADKWINSTNGKIGNNTGRAATVDYFACKPNSAYYFGAYNGGVLQTDRYLLIVAWYDANKAFIRAQDEYISGASITSPDNATYFRIGLLVPSYGVCISLSDPSFNGQYEPYHDGGSITADSLNGINGIEDEQDATGNITRRLGTVDLGTLTYNVNYDGYFTTPRPGKESVNYITPKYQTVGLGGASITGDKQLAIGASNILIRDDAYSGDVNAFKTALSGQYLVYELANPATDTTTAAALETKEGYNLLRPVSGDLQSGEVSMTYVKSSYLAKLIAWIRSIL